MEIKMQGNRQ